MVPTHVHALIYIHTKFTNYYSPKLQTVSHYWKLSAISLRRSGVTVYGQLHSCIYQQPYTPSQVLCNSVMYVCMCIDTNYAMSAKAWLQGFVPQTTQLRHIQVDQIHSSWCGLEASCAHTPLWTYVLYIYPAEDFQVYTIYTLHNMTCPSTVATDRILCLRVSKNILAPFLALLHYSGLLTAPSMYGDATSTGEQEPTTVSQIHNLILLVNLCCILIAPLMHFCQAVLDTLFLLHNRVIPVLNY